MNFQVNPPVRVLGLIYYHLGNYGAARDYLTRALTFYPRDPALYQTLAEVAGHLNDLDGALAYQQRAVELAGDSRAAGPLLESLGFLYAKKGDYRQAAASFRRALAAGQDNWRLRQNLGIALYKLRQWDEALAEFRVAQKQHPTPQALVYLGLISKEQGKPGLAIVYLTRALPEEDRLEKQEKLFLYNDLGYLYAKEHQYARAAQMWSKSLRLTYDPVIALYLSEMQLRQEDAAQAQETLNRINPAGLKPAFQARYYDARARIQQKQGQPAKAVEAYRQANAIDTTADR